MKVIDTIYINGEFIKPHGTEVADLINPSTNEVIGKLSLGDEIDTRKAGRQRPCEQFGGVPREQTDVCDVVRFDLSKNFCHAVDVRFAADEAGPRKRERFGNHVLAAAESDFETKLVDRRIEQRAWVGCIRVAEIQREMRQKMLDQVSLMIAELVPLASPEKRSVAVLGILVRWRGIIRWHGSSL